MMIVRSFKQNLVDLFYITGNKRVKAGELGLNTQRDELSKTEDYLEIVIGKEFNIEWND